MIFEMADGAESLRAELTGVVLLARVHLLVDGQQRLPGEVLAADFTLVSPDVRVVNGVVMFLQKNQIKMNILIPDIQNMDLSECTRYLSVRYSDSVYLNKKLHRRCTLKCLYLYSRIGCIIVEF